MLSSFEQSHTWLKQYEGGYVNHAKDPGGATNKGVTQRVYTAWLRRKGMPNADVKYITSSEAQQIMYGNYWVPAKCAELPVGVDTAMYDFAVNSGVSRAVKEFQQVLGVDADGVIGDITMAAMDDYIRKHGVPALISAFCNERLRFVQSLSTYSTFGKGWKRRIKGDHDAIIDTDYGVEDRAIWLYRTNVQQEPLEELPAAKTVGNQKATDPVGTLFTNIFSLIMAYFRGRKIYA